MHALKNNYFHITYMNRLNKNIRMKILCIFIIVLFLNGCITIAEYRRIHPESNATFSNGVLLINNNSTYNPDSPATHRDIQRAQSGVLLIILSLGMLVYLNSLSDRLDRQDR